DAGLEGLQELLRDLVRECHCLGVDPGRLSVEVFLPFELLSVRVEWWEIGVGLGESRPIGTRHRVYVRCYERTYGDDREELREAWKRRADLLPGRDGT